MKDWRSPGRHLRFLASDRSKASAVCVGGRRNDPQGAVREVHIGSGRYGLHHLAIDGVDERLATPGVEHESQPELNDQA